MNAWLFETLVATIVLMALVLVLRIPVARLFGPRAAYALWALPALRVAMPSLAGWRLFYVPMLHLSGRHVAAGLIDPVLAARLAAEDAPPLSPLATPVHAGASDWPTLLVAVWLGGALLWFGWQMLRYHHFLRHALRSAVPLTRVCEIDVLVTPAVDGPVAAGVIMRRILLPADFMTRYTPSERRLALLHEGAHHDRRDILANLVALAVLALHWWNPFAHRAYRAFRADQELACDATVLADLAAGERHAYGSAVVKSVSARMPGVACALSHKDEIKRRLRAIAAPRIGVRRMWTGAIVTVSAIGAGLMATASGQATAVDPDTYFSRADLAAIRADAAEARAEGLRDAEAARVEALREPAEARREALHEVERARAEGLRERAEALRDAARARAEALRDAARARAEARLDAARARGDALGAWREAVPARWIDGRGNREAVRVVAETRRSMVAHCAEQGRPVAADLDWSRLALCGDTPARFAARVRAPIQGAFVGQRID